MSALDTRYVIDMVVDCGADNSGATDIATALGKAFTILSSLNSNVAYMPQQTAIVYFPPGKYLLTTLRTEWVFTEGQGTSTLIVQGAGDASVIILAGGVDQAALIIANIEFIQFRDIAIIGGAPANADTGAGITLGPFRETYFRNVRIVGIWSANYALKITGGFRFVWEGGELSGSGSADTTNANLVSSAGHTVLRNMQMSDVPILDGFPIGQSQKTINGNVLCLVDLSSYDAVEQASVDFENVLLDEGCFNNLIIKGAADFPIHRVRLENVQVNGPGNGVPATPFAIHAEYVQEFVVEGMVGDLGGGAGPYPLIDLKTVQSATINVPVVTSTYTQLTVDSTSGTVIVENSDTNLSVQSSATSTVANSMNSSGVVYILASGNDTTGNGSIDYPFATLDAAVACVAAASAFLGSPINTTIQVGPGIFAAPTEMNGYVSVNGLDPNISPSLSGSIGLAAGYIADGILSFGNVTIADPQTIDFGAIVGAGLIFFNAALASAWTVEGGSGGWSYYAQSAAFYDTATFVDAVQYTSLKSSFFGATVVHALNTNINLSSAGDTYLNALTFEAAAGKTITVDADHSVQSAFTVSGAGTVNYTGNATQQVGTPGTALGIIRKYQVVATTNLAVAVTVDTGYQPSASHAANLAGDANIVDRTNNHSASQSGLGIIYNTAGVLTVRGQSWGASVGDVGLSTCAISFGVSASNTLTVTFTPPAAFGGLLTWQLETLLATEN
jgi:Pectate lyase superfamily protein